MRDAVLAAEPIEAIIRYLSSENEILRAAAIGALARQSDTAAVRPLLVSALLDPDPDVRSDAMEALATMALPEDAETLRYSLAGDPVREVKLAAIRALARLNDRGAIPLLRALTLSRAEEEVAWEDEDSDWEEWLDIQIAAIQALGQMGVEEAIDDLLAARADPLAQSLDIPVFEALTQLGPRGIDILLQVATQNEGLGSSRAVTALQGADPSAMLASVDQMIGHPRAAVRLLTLPLLPVDGDRVLQLAEADPDAAVRVAALARAAPHRPDLALTALRDKDARVQAAALRHLVLPEDAEARAVLIDNLLAWITHGAPALMIATAERLAILAPERAGPPLLALAADLKRPLEARVAATRALADVTPPIPTAALVELIGNRAQQVRLAALVQLRDRAAAGDEAAITALAAAIQGTLVEDAAFSDRGGEEASRETLTAPKNEDDGPPRIHITRDGQIVEFVRPEGEAPGTSTLSAILAASEAAAAPDDEPLAEDTPEEAPSKRRKRRPVEGPDAISEALSREALQVASGLDLAPVDAAILARARAASGGGSGETDQALRQQAWQALGRHLARYAGFENARSVALAARGDSDPVVRLVAFQLLATQGPAPDLLAGARQDPDPLIRAEAARYGDGPALVDALGDPVLIVRRAAAERLIASGSTEQVIDGVERVIRAELSDTLASLIAASEVARQVASGHLAADTCTGRAALVILKALATSLVPAPPSGEAGV
ncbi:MAG: HEAT repeat domain-containing protein [Pseudomonadota bacterium]